MPEKGLSLMAFWVCLTLGQAARAEDISIAVAANFTPTLEKLGEVFRQKTGHGLKLSSGSSNRLVSQIRAGAPFDLFFSADSEAPRILVQDGIADAGSLYCYAVGKLVLWSPKAGFVDAAGNILRATARYSHLAIANPALAPYGRAAQQVLEKLGLWDELKPKLVEGESVAQAFQFVRTGNAELGFVALSQARGLGGSLWTVPQENYQPLRQEMVVLKRSKHGPGSAISGFVAFLHSPEAGKLIEEQGYQSGAVK